MAPSSETAGTRGQAVRSVSVLGATGSVGQSTIDLICRNRDAFTVEALTAQTNVAALAEAARRTGARLAVIGDANLYDDLRAALAGTGIDAAAGPDAIVAAAAMPADCVVAAIVGAAGLAPTLEAARQGRRLALANKECLVSAGDVFMSTVADAGCELLPVDSEHSGALQALAGASAESIERITLTASGGPFRTWSLDELQHVTPEQALRHPNWSMGAKITIDSATLMNKGLELIEAYHLFPVTAEQLGAVVHPQSIIHCLVSYIDGSVMAQMACPDMRTPIALALSWPGRMQAPTQRLDLASIGQLSFEAPDEVRFPALKLARDALTRGATAPAILSAANEVAVEAFLSRRIGFLDIARNVADALEAAEKQGLIAPAANLGDVLEADSAGRRLAQSLLGRYV
ncbi:1-deoxy-D-xylulose-5-phosphate reductoisomerase [Hyphomicrobium sp. D-2]|uniref:1-deoxy-D-xylulose-5-phosphate reductoisomerase n=1 Tax=Hyphomicrobium sp. D-2 TaxID=3041621 RepID=UPI0024540B95|nr:1-deoxy-D-xylulose-5-phosphate reductoisomerase [Hyphomicrobium sp. D-2]MDH4981396.1 1-deoxy-D-xylulose-5-phosphate reductoisomerase [Hyphomicrobium sp. D-2]